MIDREAEIRELFRQLDLESETDRRRHSPASPDSGPEPDSRLHIILQDSTPQLSLDDPEVADAKLD